MTPENDDRQPPQETGQQPEKNKSTLAAINDSAVGQKANQALKTVTGTAAKVQRNPVIAHLLRAAERFNDRLGNQFGAAITYFSFLSMIPILMVSFAAAGFVLAWHPTLLQDIFDKILQNVSDPTLAATLKNTINTAVQQRTAVGLVGLLVALVITLSITSVAGSAQQMIISALYLDYIEWLKPAWRLIGLAISIFANYLLFFWIFWRLPRHRPRRKALFRGTLIAAIGFEIIKIVMTWTLPALVKSPSGAAFGSVLGLMAFFYFFARLTLFCAAWIATAEYKDDKRMPGKAHD
ncbi:YhjD/YihY/BrkB family envelope integrity protein [Klebsiella aerogenes]